MRFRSPLLSQSRFLSFPPGTEMVHFPGFARTRLWIRQAVRGFYPRGFPHSEISGSKPACGSPKLIAACHVFHRRLLPRHPPCALSSLTTKFTQHTVVLLPSHCHPERSISFANAKLTRSQGTLSLLPDHHTPNKLYSATLLLARLDMFSCSANCKIPRFFQLHHLGKMDHPIEEVLRTPAGTAALIKIYFALYLPNLFSCQSSSSEKRRWSIVAGR